MRVKASGQGLEMHVLGINDPSPTQTQTTQSRIHHEVLRYQSPDQAVQVQALAGHVVHCSWAKHFILTVPLSAQVYFPIFKAVWRA